MKFIKDAVFWTKKIAIINTAIESSELEASKLRDQHATCFDPEDQHLLEIQIEAWEAQIASFVKERNAAKICKFA